jgi:hypothetical protein
MHISVAFYVDHRLTQRPLFLYVVFRRLLPLKQGVQTSPDKALTYKVHHPWVKRLGEAFGYLQSVTTYCLRRALGNGMVPPQGFRPYECHGSTYDILTSVPL